MRTPPPPEMTRGFLIQLVFCKKKTMWFIGVEVEQETSAPPPKKNPGSAPVTLLPNYHLPSTPFNEYLTSNRLPDSFNFEPIIPTDISAQIQALPLYKSYGIFSCPVKILKGWKHIISQLLANVYNLSVIQGKHPSKLKLAKIVPVYKDDDESCVPAITGLFLFCLHSIEYLKN